jgi:hypothetical protein
MTQKRSSSTRKTQLLPQQVNTLKAVIPAIPKAFGSRESFLKKEEIRTSLPASGGAEVYLPSAAP